jgi:asparagine synthase (glutamine-hydrolysing)
MLKLHVLPACDVNSLQASSCGWQGSGIALFPVNNPALECIVHRQDGSFELTVREVLASNMHAPEDNWPLDFITVTIERLARGIRVRVRSGEWGTCPLYLSATSDGLWGHWDAVELYAHQRDASLCSVYAAHLLTGMDDIYATATVFPGIQRLTARASAEWTSSSGNLRFTLPAPIAQAAPHALAEDADVLAALDRTLMATMRRYCRADVPCGSFLSGGLDSAIVAITTARTYPNETFRTFGMLVPPESRNGQQKRRQALVDQFGFADTTITTENLLCFDPESERIRELAVTPWEEFYYEAFSALLDEARCQGVREMATGNGGDELCMLHFFEQHEANPAPRPAALPRFVSSGILQAYNDTLDSVERAPLALLSSSSLSAATASAPLFTRKGVWSLSPLCTPELIRLCRRLPREWRAGRRLWRDYLAKLGVSGLVTHPSITEDFGGMMALSLRTRAAFLHSLFRDSFLADAGLIDSSRLLADLRHWCAGGELPYDIAHFMYTVNLELSLRSLDRRCAMPQEVFT